MARKKDAPTEKPHAKVLKRLQDRFKYGMEQDRENRENQKSDTEFVYKPGAQWDDRTRKTRKGFDDPCLEFNQLPQFVNQVINDQRQNRPGVRVHPASGEASEEVAEIVQGLLRGIEYQSNAEAVIDCGYQHAVVGGRGYWRIVTEYEGANSLNQRLAWKRIPDPQMVLLDPDFQDPDGGDRMWGFVLEAIHKDEYPERYPGTEPISFDTVDELWKPDDDHIYVADYYERVCEKKMLVVMSDGTTGYEGELTPGPGVVEQGRREVDAYHVDWYTVAGGEQILKKHEWGNREGIKPATIIPVVCAMGDEIFINGKRYYQGLTVHAKDSMRMFNFGMTQQAVHLSLTPRAPYVGAIEAIAGYEDLYKNANKTNLSFLPFHHKDAQGDPIPAPQRQQPSTPDSGWINWTQQQQALIRSTIGMYQNSLGMQGQETSGRAIMAREKQGDNATFHYQDNLSRAIALTGRIEVELIPHYYDTERIVHIIGPDDVRKPVTINEQQVVPGAMPGDPPAYQAIAESNLTVGEYAITVEAGPSFATKRQETAEIIMGMVQAYPPLMQGAGDLVMKAQDVPDADLFAKRLKMMLPPQILQAIQAEEAGTDPAVAAAQQQVQQVQQQAQQAVQQLQQQLTELGQQAQQLDQENKMLKADKSAQVQIAEAKAQESQIRAAQGMADSQANAESDRAAQSIASDKNLIEMLKVILPLIMPQPQALPAAGATATQMLDANP